jgi:hypothetical protein
MRLTDGLGKLTSEHHAPKCAEGSFLLHTAVNLLLCAVSRRDACLIKRPLAEVPPGLSWRPVLPYRPANPVGLTAASSQCWHSHNPIIVLSVTLTVNALAAKLGGWGSRH